ncbi:MAG: peptide deformylase [Lachnospiraceae bacterium]|nr:peptide deformylase [Lachnospiraceae bacterium]
MSIRTIRVEGDEILNKKSKPIKEMTARNKQLVSDMLETMYDAQGVGLAAVQVGILKRIVVIDVGEGPIILINPEIIETSGEQCGYEGCLSVPGKRGIVTRPNYVKVRAQNENMETYEVDGTELLARAFCHEIAHLEGELYTSRIEGPLEDVEYDDYEDEDFEDEDFEGEE